MKLLLPIGFIVLLALYHLVGHYAGFIGKIWALGIMIVLSAGLSFALWLIRTRMQEGCTSQEDNQHEAVSVYNHRLLKGDRLENRWQFKFIDTTAALSLTLLPPLLISIFTQEHWSGNSAFTGFHLLAMGSGAATYLTIRYLVIARLKRRKSKLSEVTNEKNNAAEQGAAANP